MQKYVKICRGDPTGVVIAMAAITHANAAHLKRPPPATVARKSGGALTQKQLISVCIAVLTELAPPPSAAQLHLRQKNGEADAISKHTNVHEEPVLNGAVAASVIKNIKLTVLGMTLLDDEEAFRLHVLNNHNVTTSYARSP